MSNQVTITVFEHQAIKVDGVTFSKKHLELLERFRGDKEDEYFPYYSLIHNGVKFKHYVGVLNVGSLQIEVLPKVDRAAEDKKDLWRDYLLHMLRTVYRLQAHSPSNAQQQLKDSPVLDVFLQRFLGEVEALLHVGLIKTYRKETANRNALKGKIVWSKQVTKNVVHKERFYVNYTTYDRNHIMNRIIYKTLQVIPEVTRNSYIASRSKTLAFEFPELLDINVTDATFATMHFDRKSDGYRDAMQIAKLILLNYMPDMVHHRNNVLALMFDMNRLWEEYVYVVLRKELKDYSVTAQSSKRFWEGEGTPIKHIRPDIVISYKNVPKLVIDTKWKCPNENAPSDADLKQMYVYHKFWGVDHTILLYPSASKKDPITGTFHIPSSDDDKKLTCSMVFATIEKENIIITEELLKLLWVLWLLDGLIS